MKRAVQSDLRLDHVTGAAAVAQKGTVASGGAVSKTSVNKHQKKSIPSDSEREEPSQHFHVGPMWVFDGLSLGPCMGNPSGAQTILSIGSPCVLAHRGT